jgi:spoIIIJ-associated protein
VSVEGSSESAQALPGAPVERVRALLEQVVAALGLDASVEVIEEAGEIHARIEGDDLGLLIGRRGQTIDALQLLCYRAAFRGAAERSRVVVDAAGYRKRRAEALNRQADQAAERAVGSRRPVELEPMSATERRVIHEHLKARPEIETYSEGEEPERFVVVAPLVSE